MKLLTLCGSLRARSANRAVLAALARLAAPAATVSSADVALLPHFNPDLDVDPPPAAVQAFRHAVATADALILSTPEYAHGLPGAFKNALDWLVSDPAFAGKPVVLLHLDRGSTWALDSLREILRTMSARLLDSACVRLPLSTNRIEETDILARPDLRQRLQCSVDALRTELGRSGSTNIVSH